jgi:hypothetical protein
MLSRREFLASSASLAVTAGIGGAHAAMGPNDKFDLLIVVFVEQQMKLVERWARHLPM